MLTSPELYMQRSLQLAQLGAGSVAPNPMVGAVLVYNDRIIGEGYHRHWGGPHAEVNCIASVKDEDRPLITGSTLYVSLEPCAHFGKTPPCADLIIRMQIPEVFVGCRDPFPEVDGKGIEKLRAAGVKITTGILEAACLALNKRFFTFHQAQRPYIILKWAQTGDRKIASGDDRRLLISNEYTNRIVHKWRSEEAAILVGTGTSLADDPALTTRLWPGANPVRLVIDKELKLPATLKIFNKEAPTIVFNHHRHNFPEGKVSIADVRQNGISYYQLNADLPLLPQLLHACYRLGILSLIAEGGRATLQSFIDAGCWDEARVITNEAMIVNTGLSAPVLKNYAFSSEEKIATDALRIYTACM